MNKLTKKTKKTILALSIVIAVLIALDFIYQPNSRSSKPSETQTMLANAITSQDFETFDTIMGDYATIYLKYEDREYPYDELRECMKENWEMIDFQWKDPYYASALLAYDIENEQGHLIIRTETYGFGASKNMRLVISNQGVESLNTFLGIQSTGGNNEE